MISEELYVDKEAPDRIREEHAKGEEFEPSPDKAYCIITMILGGAAGRYLLTSAMVFREDDDGQREGWSIVNNRSGKGEFEAKFVTRENEHQFDLVTDGILYMVITEVPQEFLRPSLTHEELRAFLEPSLEYLKSLIM